jgi:hypothetical protein
VPGELRFIGDGSFSWDSPIMRTTDNPIVYVVDDDPRAWAKQIRRDAEGTQPATSEEDSELLDRAANEIENLRREIETLRSD